MVINAKIAPPMLEEAARTRDAAARGKKQKSVAECGGLGGGALQLEMATDDTSSDVAKAARRGYAGACQRQAGTCSAPALMAPPPPPPPPASGEGEGEGAIATQLDMESRDRKMMLCCAAATNGPRPPQSTAHCICAFTGACAHTTRTSRRLKSTPAGGGTYTPAARLMLMATASLCSRAPWMVWHGESDSPQPGTSLPVGATLTSTAFDGGGAAATAVASRETATARRMGLGYRESGRLILLE